MMSADGKIADQISIGEGRSSLSEACDKEKADYMGLIDHRRESDEVFESTINYSPPQRLAVSGTKCPGIEQVT